MRPIIAILPLLILSGIGVTAPAAAEPTAAEHRMDLATFRDKLKGGWAGQMVGVSYGSVYEFQSNGQRIEGPLRPWKPEYIENTIHQDDLYVEMTFLETLERCGLEPTAREVGEAFRDSKYALWHANYAARVNLKAGIMPPESGHPRYNPHSDDIDFQIEADLFGLIAPGLFQESARLCDRFGSVMNYGDGLYAGRFMGAMYAQAYLEPGAEAESRVRCVEAGLKSIPAESRYAMVMRDVLDQYRADPTDWVAAWEMVETQWAQEDLCPEGENQPFNIDAKVNGAYVVIGLLYGDGDFEKTCEIATRCGQDADCNPSSAAGVLGTLIGFEAIPEPFVSGLPALEGQKFSYTDYDLPALLKACETVALELLERSGGRVETTGEGSKTELVIPTESPEPPAKLEQLIDFSAEERLQWREEFDRRAAELKLAPG